MATVIAVTAERRSDTVRQGSQAMNEHGIYALHVDYLADCMGASLDAVRRARIELMQRGWLSQVHPGTFGRPTTYQALIAGPRRAPVRGGVFYQPYGPAELPTLTARDVPSQGGAELPTLASTGETKGCLDPDTPERTREPGSTVAQSAASPGQPSTTTPALPPAAEHTPEADTPTAPRPQPQTAREAPDPWRLPGPRLAASSTRSAAS